MVYGDMVCGIWYTVLEYMVYCWVFFAVLSFGSRLPQFEYMNLVRHGGADAADEDGHGDADDDGADGNTDGDAGCGDASTATTIPDTVKMEVITTLQTTAAAPTPATAAAAAAAPTPAMMQTPAILMMTLPPACMSTVNTVSPAAMRTPAPPTATSPQHFSTFSISTATPAAPTTWTT